jgi:formate hydrogenlyase subunit 6/NADH:ubiquinone oxidoreductase subunit I
LVCPTGAIKPISVEEKKLTQLGKTDLNKNECIVYKFNRDCGACAEHCPTKAVYMVPYKNIYGPVTNTDVCIGCGSCQNVCPVSPEKAIIVKPNLVHIKIDKNAKQEDEKLKEKKNVIKKTDDFPF